MRVFGLIWLVFAIFGIAHAQTSCDLSMQSRSQDTATYIESGQACLNAPPEGMRFAPAFEIEFFERINHARETAGLAPLALRLELQGGARFHSMDMAANQYFNHGGLDGSTVSSRLSAFDRSGLRNFTAENLSMISGHFDESHVVQTLHNGLMNSPGHRANILTSEATHMAIGVVRFGDGVWVTQVFAKMEGEISPPIPARLRQNDILKTNVRLFQSQWKFARYSINWPNGDEDLAPPVNGETLIQTTQRGSAGLSARSHQVDLQNRMTAIIRFPGPSVSIVGADAPLIKAEVASNVRENPDTALNAFIDAWPQSSH